MSGVEFGIYVPQVTSRYGDLLSAALSAEELGFTSFWLFDHLYAPGAPQLPSLEGWTTATALLASTTRLRVGNLVLCNNFRHPALVAKMATTLDVISGGRLELGLGSGSVEREHDEVGIAWGSGQERSERLAEALEIITRMFATPRTDFSGAHYEVRDLPNVPGPVQQPRPPIHIGGAGPKYTLPLVARYADVWNVPTYALADWDSLTATLERNCAAIGRDPASIRRSHEAVLGVAATEAELPDVRDALARRFEPADAYGLDAGYIGTPAMLVDRIGERVEQGITSFAFMVSLKDAEATMRHFAAHVMPQL